VAAPRAPKANLGRDAIFAPLPNGLYSRWCLADGRCYDSMLVCQSVRYETTKIAAIFTISRPFKINRHYKDVSGTNCHCTLPSPTSCARYRRSDLIARDPLISTHFLPKSARHKSTSLSTLRPTKTKWITTGPASSLSLSYEVCMARIAALQVCGFRKIPNLLVTASQRP
jgi:hypothetical protein